MSLCAEILCYSLIISKISKLPTLLIILNFSCPAFAYFFTVYIYVCILCVCVCIPLDVHQGLLQCSVSTDSVIYLWELAMQLLDYINHGLCASYQAFYLWPCCWEKVTMYVTHIQIEHWFLLFFFWWFILLLQIYTQLAQFIRSKKNAYLADWIVSNAYSAATLR